MMAKPPLRGCKAQIYPYRRNVAGSIIITLFAIHGALTTKTPLPQFLPSARLAHLRMVNRVREVVLRSVGENQENEAVNKLALQLALRRKYMSWNAASAAQAEIIEFLEELIELTKLLVGANEFRSGLLTRPTHHQYTNDTLKRESTSRPGEPVGDAAMNLEARDELKRCLLARLGLGTGSTPLQEVMMRLETTYLPAYEGSKAGRWRREFNDRQRMTAGIKSLVEHYIIIHRNQ